MRINSKIILGLLHKLLQMLSANEKEAYYKNLQEKIAELNEKYPIETLISVRQELRWLPKIFELLTSPTLGFDIGSQLTLYDIGVLGYFLKSCRHMIHMLQKLEKYQLLVSDAFNFNVHQGKEFTTIKLTIFTSHFKALELLRFWSDLEMIICHNNLIELTGHHLIPARIDVIYEGDEQHRAFLQKKYNCKVNFNADANALVYQTSDLTRFIPSSNYHLYTHLEPKLKQLLEKWNMEVNGYSQRVKNMLLNNLTNPDLSKEFIAQKLNLSPRHLQRLLNKENNSYKYILEEMRKEKSLIYLYQGLSNKEIAAKLGYIETNSFTKAFKKWFGKNTSEFRF